MSKHQDVKNAQAAVNEWVAEFVGELKGVGWLVTPKFVEIVKRWDAFEELRNDFEGPGAASARRTSINAANAKIPLKGSMRRSICEVIASQFREFRTGMTCDQLEARLRKPHQTVSPAVNHLERAGWIFDSGEERKTRSGQPAIVWAPTDKLIDRLRDVELGAS